MKRFGLATTVALFVHSAVCAAQTPPTGQTPAPAPAPAAAPIPAGPVAGGNPAAYFTVGNIRLEGLQRISEGTVFNYLPINIGDQLSPERIREAIRALYGTGFFRDVQMRREGDTLVVVLLERPAIESFEITGNKDIKTEDLQKSLRNVGLAAGKTFDRSVLEEVRSYLIDQYFSRGKYAIRIDEKVEDEPGNKVKIKVDIKEGARAKIRAINIVGNHRYTDKEAESAFELHTPNWLSWYKQDDRYSSESLDGDLERLRSYYMDRGYANFQIDSTQVTIAPEKDDIFITINVEEGGVFKISGWKLAGTFPVPKEQLERLVLIEKGQVYSRKLVTATQELIQNRLGMDGYAFAKVDPVPTTDPATGTVAITFFVDPGNRVYVRNITFSGTKRINDEVLRRELRILEGGWLSNVALDRSKQRLQQLPYITKVDSETNPVPGSSDQVDVDYKLEEGPGASISGGIGYSEIYKFELNGNYTDANWLGTGQRVSVNLETGLYNKVYSIAETNPYTTVDNLTRTYSLSFRDVSQFTSTSSDFSTKILTAGESFGYPLSEYQGVNLGLNVQAVQLVAVEGSSALQAQEWVRDNGNTYSSQAVGLTFDPITASYINGYYNVYGSKYVTPEVVGGWSYNTRNRALFADHGMHQTLSFAYAPPVTGVSYYKVNYELSQYIPIYKKWVFSLTGNLGYGAGLGKTTSLPPYELFYGGGPDSVRGFMEGTLGPRDQYGNPYGGNMNVLGRAELILPMPDKVASSARAALFFDAGNVFSTGNNPQFYGPPTGVSTGTSVLNALGPPISYGFAWNRLKYSVGLGVQWLSPMGLFRFSYAVPLNATREVDEVTWGDDTERFQFSVGQAF
ncbi:MAG TPA: outer membrane protein assembly factor BamA [Steroidobacteraceae bacterium]|nr:outer membrane protein assembly factor BamA [Steroidobacteraceae bacterium]